MENKNLSTPRNIIVALAIAKKGDPNAIQEHIKNRSLTDYTDAQFEEASKMDAVTILDPEFPDALKESRRIPYVLFVASESGYGCRLDAKTRAEAWVQEKKSSETWWQASVRAQADVLDAFKNEIVVSVNEKAEITLRKGADSTTYRQYYGREPEQHDFSEAYAIAAALANRLYIFHSYPQGDEALMVALFGLNSDKADNIYVMPEDYAIDRVSLTSNNAFIAQGARILTHDVIKETVDKMLQERRQ